MNIASEGGVREGSEVEGVVEEDAEYAGDAGHRAAVLLLPVEHGGRAAVRRAGEQGTPGVGEGDDRRRLRHEHRASDGRGPRRAPSVSTGTNRPHHCTGQSSVLLI